MWLSEGVKEGVMKRKRHGWRDFCPTGNETIRIYILCPNCDELIPTHLFILIYYIQPIRSVAARTHVYWHSLTTEVLPNSNIQLIYCNLLSLINLFIIIIIIMVQLFNNY